MSARIYVLLVLGLCAAVLVPVVALNMLLAANSLRVDKNRLASDWQQSTRGVTYSPPISHNRPFKTLRLNDRITEINTLVFGSSTTMGITEDVFPPPLKNYNFAQSGNSLSAVIGEAEYVVERWGAQMKLMVIPLDWALGFVYEKDVPVRAELTPESVLRTAASEQPSVIAQLTDALSLPRLKILGRIARELVRAADASAAFRQIFFEPAGLPYRCADGTPARDFDVVYRGMCNGFRYDGSATFADQKRLDASSARVVLASAVSSGAQYAAALRRGRGKPNQVLLDRLARLARRAGTRGGNVVVMLPPLMPGLEVGLSHTTHSGKWLSATKSMLEAWSLREGVTLLDAGRSERYGCTASEFIDPHHALPDCYRKVYARFFGRRRGLLAPAAAPNR